MSISKKIGKIAIISLIGLASLFPKKTKAEEIQEKPAVNLSLDNAFSNKYLFWGLNFWDKPVWQPMFNLNINYLTLNLFGNMEIGSRDVNEADAFVDFTYPINKINTSLGAGYYNFKINGKWVKDRELYTKIGMNIPLNPSIVFHRLFGLGKGSYTEASLSEDVEINNLVANLSGKLGYDTSKYREGRGFSHVEAGIKVPIKLTEKMSIIPNINFSKALARDLENEIYGGINWRYDF